MQKSEAKWLLPLRYCYALGHAAGALLATKQTGLMATIYDLHLPSSQWQAGGTPLVSMMAVERRKGKDKPVIHKALVELSGEPFKAYAAKRAIWAFKDCFRFVFGLLLTCIMVPLVAISQGCGMPAVLISTY